MEGEREEWGKAGATREEVRKGRVSNFEKEEILL